MMGSEFIGLTNPMLVRICRKGVKKPLCGEKAGDSLPLVKISRVRESAVGEKFPIAVLNRVWRSALGIGVGGRIAVRIF
jgi:hypothetical protein